MKQRFLVLKMEEAVLALTLLILLRLAQGVIFVDRNWSSLKKFIPRELASKRSNGGLNAQIQEYMYSFVWRCNTPSKHQLQKLGQMAQKEWHA